MTRLREGRMRSGAKPAATVLACGLLLDVAVAARAETRGAPLVVETGPAELLDGCTPSRLYDPTAYRKDGRFDGPSVTIREWPADLDETARVGLVHSDRIEGEPSRTFVVQGDAASGYRLRIDMDADGDLAEEAARPLARLDDGTYAISFEAPEPVAPLKLGFPVAQGHPLSGRALQYVSTVRRGAVSVRGREIAFAVHGRRGRYDDGSSQVCFDTDADGRVELARAGSDECIRQSERFVQLAGTAFEFRVDRAGDTLALVEQPPMVIGRLPIDPGQPAPEFGFEDLDGIERALSDFRGDVVLLYAWKSYCAPCTTQLPSLEDAVERFGSRGLRVIGLNAGESRGIVVAYVTERALAWPQALDESGAIQELYRIRAFPTYVLIDRDGIIAGRVTYLGQLEQRLSELFASDETGAGTGLR